MTSKSSTKKSTPSKGLSAEERAALKETLKERKAATSREEMEKAALEAISKMKEPDRSMAKRLHEIITAAAPSLMPKTWYGMPAYANKDGKVICFFQAASKFNTRYATFGFQHDAKLDDGNMWAASFALVKLTPAEEKKIIALVKKAVG
ncbi:MAG: iron chaperone [Chloroflexota bacterium]|nr:DUF1801 domain-containing protein [Chloroflexota bacterium]MBI5703161.1 DUF1801 domain-containing protein [Chloroflexota bacterium]